MTKSKPTNKKETIFIPKRSKGENERYIACNGRRLLIKCGVSVEVPPEIAEVWHNSERQREAAEERIRGFTGEGA